jgi:hypothetical protein
MINKGPGQSATALAPRLTSEDLVSTSIIVAERTELRKTALECENDDDWLPILQEDWDDHFYRYKELFITYCRRAPY